MGSFREKKDSLLELLQLAKGCLSSFWFWLPILFMGYVFIQLWMMFFIHPLTLMVLPVILIIYGLRMEEKRLKAKYGFAETRHFGWSHSVGSGPKQATESESKIRQLVEDYTRLLKEHEEDTKK